MLNQCLVGLEKVVSKPIHLLLQQRRQYLPIVGDVGGDGFHNFHAARALPLRVLGDQHVLVVVSIVKIDWN